MRYEYRHSGIDWIGDVPKHWRKEKIFRAAELITSGGTPRSGNEDYYEGDIYWIQSGDLNDGYVTDTEKKITQEGLDNSSAKLFPAGTLLVAMYGATIGKLGIQTMEAATNQACCGIYPTKRIDLKFLFYFFHAVKDKYISDSYGGGQPNISQSVIKQTYFFVPEKPEQIAIANYLDKACADIDRVVEIKRKQLEQTRFMFFAFLDEIFENKGTNWIEDRIKDIAIINPSLSVPLDIKTLVTVVPMEAVSEFGEIDNTNTCEYQDVIGGLNYFQNGDVIFAKITPCMENGKGAYVENIKTEIAFGSTEFFVLRPIGKLIGKYIYYFTRTLRFRQEAEANMKGAAGQQRVVPRNFYNAKIQFPKTIKEQNVIVEKIENFKSKNFRSVFLLEKQIEVLLNYKKSLIHEVVTGKKQVYGLSSASSDQEEKQQMQTA